MSEAQSKMQKNTELTLTVNFATLILSLIILIPAIYTVVSNLRPVASPPVITAAISASPVQVSKEKKIEEALKATVDNPCYQTYLDLGLLYYNSGMYQECIEASEKALEYNPKSDIAHNNMAAAYGAMSKWEEEIEECKKALAINPDLAIAKGNLAWAEKMKNQK